MSFNRFQGHSDEYADYYSEDYYDDDRSDYTYDPDDGDSANRIEVGSAQFDAQSYIEGPAVTGSWSAVSVRSGVSRSTGSYGRRASTTSSEASSNDWRRLLGPVDLSTTAASSTPPEFASNFGDESDSAPPSPTDATHGFNLRYIMQDLSSASLPDFVSKSLTAEKQQHLQGYRHHLDLSEDDVLFATPQEIEAGELEGIQNTECEEEELEPRAYSIELVPTSDNHGKEERNEGQAGGASPNDWSRLLGPVNLPTTTAFTPLEFASTPLHFGDENDSVPPSPADATHGFNLPYIMQDLSSVSLPKPLIAEKQ